MDSPFAYAGSNATIERQREDLRNSRASQLSGETKAEVHHT